MFTRARRLFSSYSVPGWVLLGWAVLGEIHVATFALELFRNVDDFVKGHLLIDLVVGFVWLFVAIQWPEWKQKIPINLPKSMHERMHEIQRQVLPRIEATCTQVTSRLTAVEAQESKHEAYHVGIEERCVSSDAAVERLEKRIEGAISWLERLDITGRFTSIENRLGEQQLSVKRLHVSTDKLIELLPSYFRHQEFVGDLKSLIGDVIQEFLALRYMYPSSPPVVAPFSHWRPQPGMMPSDPAIQVGERLAQSLEVYEQQAQVYAIRWKGDPFSGMLFVLIAQWRNPPTNNVSADEFLGLLKEQYTNLENMQDTYAARWTKEVKQSSTIS